MGERHDLTYLLCADERTYGAGREAKRSRPRCLAAPGAAAASRRAETRKADGDRTTTQRQERRAGSETCSSGAWRARLCRDEITSVSTRSTRL